MGKDVCNNGHDAGAEVLSGKGNGLKYFMILNACITALVLCLTACGGGDSGGSSGNDSGTGSKWDSMTWDKGTWG